MMITERQKFFTTTIGFGIALLLALIAATKMNAATLCDSYNSGGDNNETFGTSAGAKWEYQSFTPGADCNLAFVGVWIKKNNAPGQVTVHIRAASGGQPTGSDLTTGTVAETNINSGYTRVMIPVTDLTLTGGTQYAMYLSCDASCDNTNNYDWYWDESSPSYSGGNAGTSNNSGATVANNYTSIDAMFELWAVPAGGGGGTTTTTVTTTVGMTITNPTQDFFNGILLFAGAFGTLIFALTKSLNRRKGVMT